MMIEAVLMVVVLVALLRAARSAILVTAGIIGAAQTLLISVAPLRETIALTFPKKRRRRDEAQHPRG